MSEIQQKNNVSTESILTGLEKGLLERKNLLRPHQVVGFEKLIDVLKKGVTQGLFKHPTGAGKTRQFGEILLAAEVPGLVLVPRKNLVTDTAQSLVEIGHKPESVKAVDLEEGNAKETLQKVLRTTNFSQGLCVVVMTYQSFLSISKSAARLLDQFMQQMKIVICDEAHRSLGEGTTEALGKFDARVAAVRSDVLSGLAGMESSSIQGDSEQEENYRDDDKLEDEQEKKVLKLISKKEYPVLQLQFTATPKLGKKDVRDSGIPVIDWVRIEDLAKDGTIILPREVNIGTAVCRLKEKVNISDQSLARLGERFEMEDGRSLFQATADAYLSEKEKANDYLPGVAFCSNIAQAEKFNQYLKNRGIRSVRCTSANKEYDAGINPKDAEEMLEKHEIDVVVTVSKVGEGWDVPTLRCAMWLTATDSPARSLQGNGRIMRSLPAESHHPLKNRSNTCVIEPKWIVSSGQKLGEGIGSQNNDRQSKEGNSSNDFESLSFYERLMMLDELSLQTLIELGIVTRLSFDIKNPEHLRVLIRSHSGLIVNGRGIDISKTSFKLDQLGWEIPGANLVKSLKPKRSETPSQIAEQLAKILWPEESKMKILDLQNDDHLKALIGKPEALISGGRGVQNWGDTLFECPERGWKRTGKDISRAIFSNPAPSNEEAENLATRLWPESWDLLPQLRQSIVTTTTAPIKAPTSEVTLKDKEYLKSLIGSFDVLFQGGRFLTTSEFRQLEFDTYGQSKKTKGVEILSTNNLLNKSASIDLLARMLWPEKFGNASCDLKNPEHLKLLIPSLDILIDEDGNWRVLKKNESRRFVYLPYDWDFEMTALLFKGGMIPTDGLDPSKESEILARRIWSPKEIEDFIAEAKNKVTEKKLKALSKEKLTPSELEEDLRGHFSSPKDLMTNAGYEWTQYRYLKLVDRNGNKITIERASMAMFGDMNMTSDEFIPKLVERFWGKEGLNCLLDFQNEDHLRMLIGSYDRYLTPEGNFIYTNPIKCPERGWIVPLHLLNVYVFPRYGNSHSLYVNFVELLRGLWPEEMKQYDQFNDKKERLKKAIREGVERGMKKVENDDSKKD